LVWFFSVIYVCNLKETAYLSATFHIPNRYKLEIDYLKINNLIKTRAI